MAIRHEKVGGDVKRYIQRVIYSLHVQFMGGPFVARGDNLYGAIGPGGPSMAAIVSPGGLPVATKFAVERWSGRTNFRGTIGGVTGHGEPHRRSSQQKV